MRKLLLFEKQAQKSGEVSPRGIVGREPSFLSSGTSGVNVTSPRHQTPPPPTSTRSGPSPFRAGSLPLVGRPCASRQNSSRDDPSTLSLLGNLEGGDATSVSTEFEIDVPIPGCQAVRAPLDPKNKNSPSTLIKFHHGTIWPNVVVHHWLKIVLRISKADENDEPRGKRRHFEISIDSPIHLLSV